VGSTSFNPCIPPLAVSRPTTGGAQFNRAIIDLLARFWKTSPRFPRWPVLCQPPPQKFTTGRDAHHTGKEGFSQSTTSTCLMSNQTTSRLPAARHLTFGVENGVKKSCSRDS
jgi:hypothetical protein